MDLKIQIYSFILSTIYGFLSGILFNISYKYLYKSKIRYRVIINILFITNLSLIYFIIMLKINNGIINVPFILFLITSFIITVNKTKELKIKKTFN